MNIPFLDLGPTTEFPSFEEIILDYGPVRYHGFEEIKEFTRKFKEGNLPRLLHC